MDRTFRHAAGTVEVEGGGIVVRFAARAGLLRRKARVTRIPLRYAEIQGSRVLMASTGVTIVLFPAGAEPLTLFMDLDEGSDFADALFAAAPHTAAPPPSLTGARAAAGETPVEVSGTPAEPALPVAAHAVEREPQPVPVSPAPSDSSASNTATMSARRPGE